MLPKKIRKSLTARIFIITTIILLGAGTITFGLIAWASPRTYTAVINDDLTRQVDALVEKLANTKLEDCGMVLDTFLRDSGADAMLVGPDGQIVNTGSQFAAQSGYDAPNKIITSEDGNSVITYNADNTEGLDTEGSVAVTTLENATITVAVRFSDRPDSYALYVIPRLEAENLAVRSISKIAPWLLLTLLIFSLLCALVYSRYITRPIVRLSGIAGKIADLDFGWICEEGRQDEIGHLGRSLNQMAKKLSAALQDLKASNEALRGEMEQERELDRRRTAFFSAASHELKTPVTILKGQLSGMLEGVGIYQDRDKYLLRSLQATGRMEKLIEEMLSISRMETGSLIVRQEQVNLTALVERQLQMDAPLLEQRGQRLSTELMPGVFVTGDNALLGKAVGNLLSNAALYSPEGAEVWVRCGILEGHPILSVENFETQISEEALPHLFEPFYREESSRSRSTGGSGLGLYLAKMIFDRHGAKCQIHNIENGVQVIVRFNDIK